VAYHSEDEFSDRRRVQFACSLGSTSEKEQAPECLVSIERENNREKKEQWGEQWNPNSFLIGKWHGIYKLPTFSSSSLLFFFFFLPKPVATTAVREGPRPNFYVIYHCGTGDASKKL
jgi:hypothetical protein